MIDWRTVQKKNFKKWQALIDFLEIDKDQILHAPSFPLNIPRRLAEKVKKGSLNDPILRQFLPTKEEVNPHEGFSSDPVSDQSFQKTPRLLQKYA